MYGENNNLENLSNGNISAPQNNNNDLNSETNKVKSSKHQSHFEGENEREIPISYSVKESQKGGNFNKLI